MKSRWIHARRTWGADSSTRFDRDNPDDPEQVPVERFAGDTLVIHLKYGRGPIRAMLLARITKGRAPGTAVISRPHASLEWLEQSQRLSKIIPGAEVAIQVGPPQNEYAVWYDKVWHRLIHKRRAAFLTVCGERGVLSPMQAASGAYAPEGEFYQKRDITCKECLQYDWLPYEVMRTVSPRDQARVVEKERKKAKREVKREEKFDQLPTRFQAVMGIKPPLKITLLAPPLEVDEDETDVRLEKVRTRAETGLWERKR